MITVFAPGEVSRIEMADRSDGRSYIVRIADGRRVVDLLETDFVKLYTARNSGQAWQDLNPELVRQLSGAPR